MVRDRDEASRRLLLVDDDEALLRHMSVALGRLIATPIDTFTDGNRAIASAKAVSYAAAVLDMDMPALDGLSLARALREIDRELPIFFVTGSSRDASATKLDALAPIEVIAKPVRPAILAEKLRPFL